MKLDGKRSLDVTAARDGKGFVYEIPAPYGPKDGPATLTVKLRHAGTANPAFMAAISALQAASVPRTDERWLFAFYDHCVVDWSTNIQSEGKDLEANRDNFIELMSMTDVYSDADADHFAPEVARVMFKLHQDALAHSSFYLERKASAEKN